MLLATLMQRASKTFSSNCWSIAGRWSEMVEGVVVGGGVERAHDQLNPRTCSPPPPGRSF
ncbi:hypothetical protein M407DRAFT_204132 [Tulasnella calospora MUT 4182]|uniref:Uncharacterized protein n=1 Tax=Tulasnella calospora MUT 4182 TaxID=1051891 RepID=A0A0C3Q8E8_9AGAM|nr:hypothetical protein M407DRAFT_204132 [Tulasnella calospora MUT 4182]